MKTTIIMKNKRKESSKRLMLVPILVVMVMAFSREMMVPVCSIHYEAIDIEFYNNGSKNVFFVERNRKKIALDSIYMKVSRASFCENIKNVCLLSV